MSHPIVTTVTIIAGNASLLATSQNGFVKTALTLVAGATLDAPRRIIVTSAGNDSGITFTVTGTARNEQGNIVQSETISGSNAGAATTTQDFLTVTSVVPSANTASTVTVGTSGTASGPWVVWDSFATPFQVNIQGNVLSGAPTWSVEVTQDDVFGTWLPVGVPFPRASLLSTLTNQTTAQFGQLTQPYRASRLTLTVFGSVSLTQQQTGS